MLRKMNPSDRENYYALSQAFYRSEAVLHDVDENNFVRTFDLIMDKSPYVLGYMFVYEDITVGFALLSLTYSNEAGGLVVWAEEAYILPEYRGKGLGNELFDLLESEFAGQAKRIRLEVAHENKRAAALYIRRGYQDFGYRQMIKEF